jgi:hypothetical protein
LHFAYNDCLKKQIQKNKTDKSVLKIESSKFR